MQPNPTKLLILDLDETLVHATKTRLPQPEDLKYEEYYLYKRPYLLQFLTGVASHFSLGIWSSAGDVYVNEITRLILPETIRPAVIWGRSKCTVKRNKVYDTYYFEKKLDKLKKHGFLMEHMLIVDDTPEKAASNYGNAIYIKPFNGQADDEELLHLHNYLLTIKEVSNVRLLEKRGWRNS